MTSAQAETTRYMERESEGTFEYRTQAFCWGWYLFGALVGLVGGIVAAFVGSIFTAISWITGSEVNGGYMQTLGTDFLLLTIPILILGAHCLDVVEKGKNKERKAEFDENK